MKMVVVVMCLFVVALILIDAITHLDD